MPTGLKVATTWEIEPNQTRWLKVSVDSLNDFITSAGKVQMTSLIDMRHQQAQYWQHKSDSFYAESLYLHIEA